MKDTQKFVLPWLIAAVHSQIDEVLTNVPSVSECSQASDDNNHLNFSELKGRLEKHMNEQFK